MPSRPGPAGRSLLVACTMVAMVAVACGGGGGATAPMTLLTVPVVTTAAPLTQPQLLAIVVQPGDLPADWKAQPASRSATQSADSAAFAQCVGSVDSFGDAIGRVFSPTFAMGAATITSSAATYRSASDVQSDNAALNNPKAGDCFVSVVRARWSPTLPKGASITSVTQKVTLGPNGGPSTVVATVTGSIVFRSGKGRTLTLNSQVVYLATSRFEGQIVFYSDTPLADPLVSDVVRKVAGRVPKGS